MTTRPLVALDIGATKVACAIGLPHEHTPGFELLGTSLVAYPARPDGWLSEPLAVGQTIEQALEAAGVSGDFDRAVVAINPPSLASERTRAMVALADEPITVRSKDLERLQAHAVHHILGIDREPLLIERLSCTGNGFDGVRDPRGLAATRLAGVFHILTMPLSARRALVQAVESAGLEVARLTYALPAALAGAGDESLSRKRIIVVDIGGLTAEMGLFIEGVLHAVSIVPWGGLTLSTEIAQTCRVTMDQAIAWSLEGRACRKPEAHALIDGKWQSISEALTRLLEDQPRPDAVLVCGRGALMDGFVEWIEQAIGIPASLCRSPRTSQLGDLSRQIGLVGAIGLLELALRDGASRALRPSRGVNRLLERTRTILTEYF